MKKPYLINTLAIIASINLVVMGLHLFFIGTIANPNFLGGQPDLNRSIASYLIYFAAFISFVMVVLIFKFRNTLLPQKYIFFYIIALLLSTYLASFLQKYRIEGSFNLENYIALSGYIGPLYLDIAITTIILGLLIFVTKSAKTNTVHKKHSK